MSTIFSKIIEGSIPAYKVAENDDYLAFLDIGPLAAGHTLVIPKEEVDYIFDLESDAYNGLWNFSKDVAKAIKVVCPCEKVGIAVIGLEVAHAHIHLVPINGIGDLNFKKARVELSKQEFEKLAEDIQSAYLNL